MKVVRYVAVAALALAAIGGVAPNANAGSPLCPTCVAEGIVQGSGIVPDPTKLEITLNFRTYSTNPVFADHFNVAFSGTITSGGLNQPGIFEAEGTFTSNIPVPGGGFLAGPSTVSTYNVVDKPVYPLMIFAEDLDSGYSFYGDVYPKPFVGVSLPDDLWTAGLPYGQPLVGTASVS